MSFLFSKKKKVKDDLDQNLSNARDGGSPGMGESTRRRNSALTNQSTLLPSTYNDSTSAAISSSLLPNRRNRHPQFSPSANTCNKFLMGGNYYPGKDKKRLRAKKTLWYRIFFSSPLRLCISAFVATYVCVWHVVVPCTNRLLYYGQLLSGGSSSYESLSSSVDNDDTFLERLIPESDGKALSHILLAIPSVQEERDRVQKLFILRDKLNEPQSAPLEDGDHLLENRRTILEAISPYFFRRNQPQKTATAQKRVQKESKSKSRFMPKDNNQHHRILRTLENMHLFAANQSRCPANGVHVADIQTTLVVQTSWDRIMILAETCKRWKDPIVVAVALRPDDAFAREERTLFLSEWNKRCPQMKLILQEWGKEDQQQGRNDKLPENYPVNHLRNMALDEVQTSHVLVVDVDFVPSQDLHKTIRDTLVHRQDAILQLQKEYLHQQQNNSSSFLEDLNREALVIPAFDRILKEPCTSHQDCMKHLQQNSSFIPNTFDELRECVIARDCDIFQREGNWEGHSSTRSVEWLAGKWYQAYKSTDHLSSKNSYNTSVSYAAAVKLENETDFRAIRVLRCFDSLRYEPYVAIRWCPAATNTNTATAAEILPKNYPLAPYYDERFHGYGKNKIEHVQHLRFLGYHFVVLPEGFVVHNPHVESEAKDRWNNIRESTLHKEMDELYPKFLRELGEKYRNIGQNPIVQACPSI